MNTRWRLDETKVLIYASYLIVILVFWGPVVWMVSLSLKTVGEILAYPPKLFPSGFVIENYGYIFTQSTIPRNMLNSAKITVVTVVVESRRGAPAEGEGSSCCRRLSHEPVPQSSP